jgi:Zn-dependent M28 family amino/carboxypeptidase
VALRLAGEQRLKEELMGRSKRLSLLATFVLVAALSGVTPVDAAAPAVCENRTNNSVAKLLECVTVEGVREHQEAFQAIADANGGTRASGTPGYDASVDYVVEKMTAAGYDVTVDLFEFDFFEVTEPPVFERTSPSPTVYVDQQDFDVMTFSGSGDVNAAVEAVDLSIGDPAGSSSGCEVGDFAGFTAGNVALMQRGACSFAIKAQNAEAAGASGAVIFNQGTPPSLGLLFGTLGAPGSNIPVIGISFDLGVELSSEPTEVHLDVQTISEARETANVFAETPGGKADNIVMAGAHLDSVTEGPGIQDNGSGSGALLEIAEQMQKVKPTNKLRFAWWGAEEFGLVGSIDWVVRQADSGALNDVALYLNFDMIGSPNFVRFVYDGSTQPPGSDVIEDLFGVFWDSKGLPHELVEVGGRSDHFAFAAFGVPIGGLFTGAEVIKTPDQAALYGGVAGEQFDPCYHLVCDTFENVSLDVLDQMTDATAFAILTYSMNTESVNGVSGKGNFKQQNQLKPLEKTGPDA